MTSKENNNWGTGIKRRKKKKSKPVVALQDGIIKMWFPSASEAENKGYSQSLISKCCNKLKYKHKKHQWLFQDDYLADWWDKEMNKGA